MLSSTEMVAEVPAMAIKTDEKIFNFHIHAFSQSKEAFLMASLSNGAKTPMPTGQIAGFLPAVRRRRLYWQTARHLGWANQKMPAKGTTSVKTSRAVECAESKAADGLFANPNHKTLGKGLRIQLTQPQTV